MNVLVFDRLSWKMYLVFLGQKMFQFVFEFVCHHSAITLKCAEARTLSILESDWLGVVCNVQYVRKPLIQMFDHCFK